MQTEDFQNMNVGIALTVGIGSEGPELPILHQDKTQIGKNYLNTYFLKKAI